MGWEGSAPPIFFHSDKIVTPVVVERHGIEEFRLYELHAFQGIAVLKPLMFQKKQFVSNAVCLYTVLAVCVCVDVQEKAVCTAHVKNVLRDDD